ncbi:MAG TPA: hypothetical protein VK619_01355 [Pyrinomonadaceae bacterium]|nr:hypothetical protein [Pyrinomonadaceae bacterium]
MGASQIAEMEPSIGEVYKGISEPDDPPTSCCSLEATTLQGSEVWIQAMPGTVNMAYPFTEEPLEMLRKQNVNSPPDIYLVEWSAGEFATFGFGDISSRDHAFFVDQLFVKILGCDDSSYKLKILIEPLET